MAKYTQEEEGLIEDLYLNLRDEGEASGVYKYISDKLADRGFERSPEAVRKKCQRLGLPPLRDNSDVEDEDIDTLTTLQKHLITSLPDDIEGISKSLEVEVSTVEHLIHALREKDVKVREDDHGIFYLKDEPKKRRLSSKAKSTITKEANEFRTEQEAVILRRLRSKPPLKVDIQPNPSKEDMVIAMGDNHFGDVVENDEGDIIYNSDLASKYVTFFCEQVIKLKKLQEEFIDFENAHIIITGDEITNEAVYSGQQFDIEAQLGDQLSLFVTVFTQFIKTVAEHFNKVQVVAIPGNHGRIRADGHSTQANLDLLGYRWLKDRLLEAGYRNQINFVVGEASHYRNVNIRKHQYHLRHGHQTPLHIDATARSEADSRAWLLKHGCDVVVRGHYHRSREEDILNRATCVTVPSPKPGSDFAEKIGSPDCSEYQKIGTIWRVSDDRPMIGKYVIDDIDFNPDAIEATTLQEIQAQY